jgi:hypothetical protein
MNKLKTETQLPQAIVSDSIDWRKSVIKGKLIIEIEKPKQLGGQQCGMPIHAVIVKSEDLEIEIKVKHFRQNHKNRELATLLMELAIDELIR